MRQALFRMTATAPGTCSLAGNAAEANVTLTLTASINTGAATDTVWGMLPGSGADRHRGLIVNTHTDGPNVPEENGALGMLALAQYFAQREHGRDLYFVMVTGHFQLPQFIEPIPNPTGSWSARTRSASG